MSPEEDVPDSIGRSALKSGAVTAVAVINFVFGALTLLCGLLFMLGGALFGSMFGAISDAAAKQPNVNPADAQKIADLAAKGGGWFAAIFAVIGFVVLLFGIFAIIGGVGVIGRKQWGRILTLVLGALAGLLTLLFLAGSIVSPGNIIPVVFFGAYCALVFVILLKQQYAVEFS